MSLTSYRTAPPRVTDFPSRPIREANPNHFQRKARNDFAAHSGRHGRVHEQPAEPRAASGGMQLLKEALPAFQRATCVWLGRPGSDLLSRILRYSTIDAGGLNDRVRNGIGWGTPAKTTRSAKPNTYNNYRLSFSTRRTKDYCPCVDRFFGRHVRRHVWVLKELSSLSSN